MPDNKQGVIKKQQLTTDEVREIRELMNICNAYEGLDLKLSPKEGSTGSGNEINDFFYYRNGKLIGFLALDRFGSQDREVAGMVHPDYRRKGIFRTLLMAAKEECTQRGISRLILISEAASPAGKAFAEAMGASYDFSEYRMELAEVRQQRVGVGALVAARLARERIQLQKANAKDIGVLAHITAAAFGSTEERVQEHILTDLREPNCQFYIGKLGEKPVGCFKLYENEKEVGIYGFGVLPEYQGKGYGRQMLEQIISQIRVQGQKRITLEVDIDNTNAVGLYRSCGFKEVTTYGYYTLNI